jgi:prepilin peptidase CpaA
VFLTDQIAAAAWWFLPFVVPIGIWVAWSDMARMKIPNVAVLALVGVFAAVGLMVVATGIWAFETWAWRWVHLLVVLVIGFLANMVGAMGAGDAKFAAAMAPFIVRSDALVFVYLLAAVVIVGFALHRIARASSWVRARTPDWESWTRKDFPMGLCLASALVIYIAAGALWGV